MIDLSRETLISITEVARRIPSSRGGRRVSISTLYRWISRGIGGRRLEALKVGGALATSLPALQRLSRAVGEQPPRGDTPDRADNVTAAERELAQKGL